MDDVFVIVLFTSFMGLAQGGHFSAFSLLSIPISIALGILSGLVLGMVLARLWRCQAGQSTQATIKGLVLLACAFLLVSLEDWLEGIVPLSGLLGVMSMAVMVQRRTPQLVGQDLSQSFPSFGWPPSRFCSSWWVPLWIFPMRPRLALVSLL